MVKIEREMLENFKKDRGLWLWFVVCGFFVIIIPTPVWVFDFDFDWGVAI